MSSLDILNRFKFQGADLNIQRSKFKMPFEHKLTMTSGDLVPVGLVEVLPGDSFKLKLSSVVRSLTPIYPTMDNSFIDVYAFFVPNRIACLHPKDWERICGENTAGYWAPPVESTLENTGNTFDLRSVGEVTPGSAYNYYGLPVGDGFGSLNISSLPFTGYVHIFNEWFRDENVQAPYSINNLGTSEVNLFDTCLKVNKLHDYFTSCLPSPQKGEAVTLPLGDFAPVEISGQNFSNTKYGIAFQGQGTGSQVADSVTATPLNSSGAYNGSSLNVNLQANLADATAATINSLRQAFAIQRLLEKDARGGSRYRELLKTHFNTTIPDSTVQIPQYLGGKRVAINITQVLQTSSTNSSSPLGQTGAFSNTAFNDFLFDKSFTEHGYIHVLACIRTAQSYSQGIAKHFTRNRRFDWYYPAFANLGEQPVFKRELRFVDGNDSADAIFGYNEAWAEYRYLPNRVSGYLAPDSGDNTLTAWTYTNNFATQPSLTGDFMVQRAENVADTLAYTDSPYQFICDFYLDIEAVRPMPVYSIPGLIDHH